LCSIVIAELYYGAHKSPPAFQTINLALLAAFCPRFACLPFDEAAAQVCGRVRADLIGRGVPIGPNDVQIAAIALLHNLTVVTHNTKHFSRIPGLLFEDWHGP
jgi:tRNA(fMet)-specific endonuclease VapC